MSGIGNRALDGVYRFIGVWQQESGKGPQGTPTGRLKTAGHVWVDLMCHSHSRVLPNLSDISLPTAAIILLLVAALAVAKLDSCAEPTMSVVQSVSPIRGGKHPPAPEPHVTCSAPPFHSAPCTLRHVNEHTFTREA